MPQLDFTQVFKTGKQDKEAVTFKKIHYQDRKLKQMQT